ncbi:kinase-like domain-containing protein [Ilyonectria robusta]|uniref:kinase-like domain-containing protein n=1 Tax=Ilyonectria robusta TaxID=1079257 RepID=UPI001E8E108E|nr:kinase-like domain-containing protein [Ilyonectria robusta]KAH8675139.1 kinase-like domain-containing protein [Ilyonectria robusta]
MSDSQTPTPAPFAVSRSRGKQPDESLYTKKLREKRKAKGQAQSSDESGSEDELEPGAVVLHKMFNRRVVLHPDNTVVKSGKRIAIGEAEALKVAALAGVPAPCVHDAHAAPNGQVHIRMSYIQGQSLDTLWPEMSTEQKKDIARQLRVMIEKMRSVAPPPHLISACDGSEIRDTRVHFTYHSSACQDESAFNEFLLSALYEQTPPLVREAFSRRLRTDHRIVLSHCDLTPRNILVEDGKIKGLVDWEDSGWYPEYWEYVKFFQRPADKEWKEYAEDIFPELYHDELVDFIAMSKWQNS